MTEDEARNTQTVTETVPIVCWERRLSPLEGTCQVIAVPVLTVKN
jgi:hypothetical protein